MAGKFNLLTTLTLDAAGYNKGIDKAKQSTQNFAKGVDSIGNGVKMLGGMAAGFLAVGSAVEVTKKFINATSDGADAFEKKMKQAEFATNAFFTTIATGDFSNLLDNLKNAIEAGGEYADVLDEIQDRKRSLTVVEAQARNEIDKLKNDLAKTANKDERLVILDKIIAKEKELNQLKLSIATQERDADLKNMQLNNSLTKQQIENFILTYNKSDELRAKAQKYNQYSEEFSKLGSDVTAWKAKGDTTFVSREDLKNTSDEVKTYASILKIWGEKTDDVIDKLIQSWRNMLVVQGEVYTSTTKSEKQRTNTVNGLNELGDKIQEKTDKAEDDEAQLIKNSIAQSNYNKQLDTTIARLAKLDTSGNKKSTTVSTNWKPTVTKINDDVLDMGTTAEEKIKAANERLQQFNEDMGATMAQGIGNVVGDMALAIGNAIGGGGKLDIGKAILGSVAMLAEELGKAAIAFGMTMLAIKMAFKNPWTAIGAGVALLVVAGAMKAKMNQMSKFEAGGLVGGYSFSGDKVLARVNSGEMILNQGQQAKLFAIANGAGTGNAGGGELSTRVSGSDLVFVLNNYNKKVNSWR